MPANPHSGGRNRSQLHREFKSNNNKTKPKNKSFKEKHSWTWWLRSLIQALERLKQKDCPKFKASLAYMSPCLKIPTTESLLVHVAFNTTTTIIKLTKNCGNGSLCKLSATQARGPESGFLEST